MIRAFFNYFRSVAKKGQWEMRNDGRIRHVSSAGCPLAFAANQRCHSSKLKSRDYSIAARRFGLPADVTADILDAADSMTPTRKRACMYRNRLLAFTGLRKEVARGGFGRHSVARWTA